MEYDTQKTEHRSLRFVGPDETYGLSVDVADLQKDLTVKNLNTEDRRVGEHIVESLRNTGELPFQWTPQENLFLRRCRSEEALDYLIHRYKFKVYPKERIVADFPVYLLIEPMSTCNLRCVMCFQVDKSFTKKPFMGMMNLELYKQIIDEAAENGTGAITLASRGEPLLHPKIGEMLQYAKDKNSFFEIKLNTNGTRLTEKLCHEILSAEVNIVVVSIDSTTSEEYSKIRVRGDFDTVVKNIKMLRDIRNKHYPDAPTEIRVSGVKILEEQSEQDFGLFWSEIADTVSMVNMHSRWDTYLNPPHPEIESPCEYLWERMYVWFDGTCNPCDADYKSLLKVGMYPDATLRDIWHGKAYVEMRDKHLAGTRRDKEPCDRCGQSF